MLTLGQIDSPALEAVLFYTFAGLTCLCAVSVVLSRQIVRMALWLFGTLVCVAALYFLLHAELIAAVQLIVYAGGTLILIIFGIMLTTSNPFARLAFTPFELALGAAIGVIALVLLTFVALSWTGPISDPEALAALTNYPVATIGRVMLSKYVIPFEVVGVLLLVVMIAAAYMAKGRHRPGRETAD